MPLFARTTTPTLERLRRAPADLAEVLAARTPAAVTLWLGSTPTDEVDAQVAALDRRELTQLADVLTPESASRLMDRLEPHTAGMLLDAVPAPTAAGLLGLLPEDEASRVVRTLDADVAARVLASLPNAQSALLRGLLAWPEESAASWMRPAYLHVDQDARVADALAAARRDPDCADEGVYVDRRPVHAHAFSDEAALLGWIPLRALVVADPDAPVTGVMVARDELRGWSVSALADQEHVLRAADDSPDGVVPVLEDGVLLGVITRDGVQSIREEEGDEDAALQGGTSPLGRPYLQASPWRLWRARAPWLAVLFLAEMYTGTVLRAFEDELSHVVALAFFIPLLIGTGGNVGTQITTTLIRAMGSEGLRARDLVRVVWKESRTGVLLGLSMAAMGAARAWTLGVGGPVILTVALSLAAIVLWASLIAAVLPLILRRIGIDPAVVSSPMIATIVDGTGLMIYFTIARAVAL
ncbi:magnesium transporter [Propioniciclava coleopterorum]|uniref:Magnesium transporter MgtE n=1 Tax=Propioniciclava coleopterorum TaxID=2714937 RepID=A0A6G7Y9V5_9ACTN|nr:magnesium transporter [Propioniciclava coleopterorum]QIK73602.1 magnesium transporter [Propioniciclava coleopterorum]